MRLPVTIYADTLVFINTVLTYFLLRGTQLITRCSLCRWRILLASFIGGIYALTLLVQMHPVISFSLRVCVCIVLCLIAFGVHSIRSVIRSILVFLLLNGVFAGCMLAVCCAVPMLQCRDGIVYYDIHIPFLLLSAAVIYAVLHVSVRLFSVRGISKTDTAKVTIISDGQRVSGRGFFDTGHQLSDPFTGMPVLIARLSFVQSLIADIPMHDLCRGVADMSMKQKTRIRLLPYSTIAGEGIIPAFRCDSIRIECADRSLQSNGVYIAVSEKSLFHGDYDVLIPGSLYSELSQGERNHEKNNHTTETMDGSHASAVVSAGRTLYQRTADSPAPAEKEGRGRGAAPSCRR